jgi:hypothetical protein
LLFCCLAPTLRAQDTDFWFVAPQMTDYALHSYPAFLAVSNGTADTAHVTITLYNATAHTADIPPGGLYKLDFATQADMGKIANPRSLAGSVTAYGTHISSDVKVSAYYMFNGAGSRDIFTLKGSQALGSLFYATVESDNIAASGHTTYPGSCDQIDIVAADDHTLVEVIPTTDIFNAGPGPNPFPAGDTLRRTLQKGETLKIRESVINSLPSLAGTKIMVTNGKRVAVTVTEDMAGGGGGDTSGDQIVPVSSLGSRYIVPRGYKDNTTNPKPPERFYLVGTVDSVTVRIYTTGGATPDDSVKLGAGQAERYDIPSGVYAVYLEADHPVYVYQRTGYNEEGAALLPSIYAIGQKQLTFYQIQATYEQGFAVFRTGAQSGFRISYGTVNSAVLNVGAPIAVPNQPDWQVARFTLPSAANNRVVTIRNDQSPFALGYIAANPAGSTCMTSYGYFSAFSFELPDTTYMCTNANSVILEGGYAKSHEWRYGGSVVGSEQSLEAFVEGEYTLVMNQDPTIVTVTTFVRMINAGTICPDQVIHAGATPAKLTVTGASGDIFQWQSSPDNQTWANITGATSSAYTPGPLAQTTYYRRGITASQCDMIYSESMEIRTVPRTVPVNPHLRSRAVR